MKKKIKRNSGLMFTSLTCRVIEILAKHRLFLHPEKYKFDR